MQLPIGKAALLTAAALAVASLPSCGNKSSDKETYPDLTATFLDVGKADAIFLKTENGAVVIDCGEKGDGKKIVALLESEGVKTIDYLVITHYDKDHVGGASKVIKNFDVKNVVAPDYERTSEEIDKYRAALEQKNITPQLIREDLSFDLDGADFTIYAPKKDFYGEENDNDFSLATKVEYHDVSLLFTGDAMEERLSEIMDVGKCTLLKVPYHGRKIDNLKDFLKATSPSCAVVSTSAEEFSAKTEKALKELNIKTYATCYDGTITAVTNGSDLKITTEK